MRQRLWYSLTVSAVLWASLVGARETDPGCGVSSTPPDQMITECTAQIQALGENSALYQYYDKRGLAYVRKGDYDRAIADFDESVRRHPGPEEYSFRGYAYDAKGDYDRAIQDFDEAIRIGIYDSDSNAWNLRGNSYRHKGDYDRAIRNYDHALELVTKHVDNVGWQIHARFLNNRALAKQAKGDVEGANADFAEAKRIDRLIRCSTSPRNVLVENCLSAGRR